MRTIRTICIIILIMISFITGMTFGYIIGLINKDNSINENKVRELNPGLTNINYIIYI